MSICTKFQPMGYQPLEGGSVNFIKQVYISSDPYQYETPALFVLDNEGSIWLYGQPFYQNQQSTTIIGNGTSIPTRVFRNVKKICKYYNVGAHDLGFILFITSDNKLYFYGHNSFISSLSSDGIDNSFGLHKLLDDVKEAWSLVVEQTKRTFYALTTSNELKVWGDNTYKQFGDNGENSSSLSWIKVLDNVSKFDIVLDSRGTKQPILAAVVNDTTYLANFTATSNLSGVTYTDTYTSFSPARVGGTNAGTQTGTYVSGYQFITNQFLNKYTLIDTGGSSSEVNIYSIGLVNDGILTNRGWGFMPYTQSYNNITGAIGVSNYGIAWANNNGLFAFMRVSYSPFNVSQTGSIQTINNYPIKLLFQPNYGRGTIAGFLTASNDLYLGNSSVAFNKVDSGVKDVFYQGLYHYVSWVLNDNTIKYVLYQGAYGSASYNVKTLPALDKTNTVWFN